MLKYPEFNLLLHRVILIPIVVTSILAGLLLWQTFDLNRALRWVDETDQIIDRSGHLLKLLVDMESGTRGYIVTGDENFLQPYQEGTKRFDSEYQSLYSMVANNYPQQQQRLKEFYASYMEWHAYASQIIDLRRAGEANPTLYENQRGKHKMDALRAQILAFQSAEIGLRTERLHAAHLRWILMVTKPVLGVGFGVFLALFTQFNFNQLSNRLLHSEQRWTATLGNIGDGVIATDSEGRVTFLNQIAAALTGWSSEEAQSHPVGDIFKIINEKSGMSADDEVLQVLEERHILTLANNVALVTRDGREIPVEHSAAPILVRGGKVIGVVLVFRDVAERRQEQIETAAQTALLELTQDSVFVIDMKGMVLFWSRGAETMLGYSKDQAAGTISHNLLLTEFPQPMDEISAELMRVGHWEGDLIVTVQDGRRIVLASRWALQSGKRDHEPRVLVINNWSAQHFLYQ